MERCRSLREYSEFVSRIRKYAAEGTGIEEAVDRTVTECIAEGKAESVLLALEMKGSVSGRLRAHILAETDVPVLEEWLKAAIEADTIRDFRDKTGLKES